MPRWFLSTSPGYARVAPVAGDAFTPVAAFSLRTGGVSAPPFASLNLSEGVGDTPHAVRDNRARLLGALGLDPAAIAFATQVHGADCLVPPGPGWAGAGDALVTAEPDLALAVGVADCMGLLLWDRERRAVAAVHAGWRGMAAGAIERAIAALAERGARPSRLRIALGPRIGPCCFVVGPEVLARFPAADHRARGGRSAIDLETAARRQIARAGVAAESVLDLGDVLPARACTACNGDRFFSHRRDLGRTGRSWAIVARVDAGPAAPDETPV